MDEFVRWYKGELEKSAKSNQTAISSCSHAARTCRDAVAEVTALAQKMDEPVGLAVARMQTVAVEGAATITRSSTYLKQTYESLRRPVLKLVGGFLFASAFITLLLGAVVLWRVNAVQEAGAQQLVEYSEQQKQEMKALFDKAMEEAKESQIDREAKVKMWDELLKTLPAQQRQNLIERLRQQFYKAGEQRLSDQMRSSYDQMNGKK